MTQLRTRCEFYSTFGDREDDNVMGDQHIMSDERRPIATITPGVSIYVTALLEYVGEHILKNISRVIERDNSDEASLADLKAAIEEDESLLTVWRQMLVKTELEKRMVAEFAIHRGSKRTSRPWKVPDANELDQAAGSSSTFRRSRGKRPDTAQSISSIPMAERSSSSASGHGVENATSTSSQYTGENVNSNRGTFSPVNDASISTGEGLLTSPPRTKMARRGSVDKGLTSLFGGRKRLSLKVSQDTPFKGRSSSKAPTAERSSSQPGDTSDVSVQLAAPLLTPSC
ncbi:hypothetical protein BCV69DRAFT_85453 [Microstroma glucosiphilum]|uniref:Uncharacterized protein n=1 Tax=Pseudomicrostroma glucosiphilum TaxID=1684307 RepID=A0A316U0V8_9BASI|nr:hypothetical protein BCV69DRAFT_85453 [Pseudomicrostroma glucosiphilum]PWN18113.1 hypothetical protein BCV69DRAFT_85453 [Pseudomicrostroma glucosiphilum]